MDKKILEMLQRITKDQFDQAQLILVYADVRPAATFSIPKSRISEVTDFLTKISLNHCVGRINEVAEIIVGKEEWRVKAIAAEMLKISADAPIQPPRGKPYFEFLKMVANDKSVMHDLKQLAMGKKLDYKNKHANAICIVPHVPCSPRCIETLKQGMEFGKVLSELHPDLYWSVLKSKSSSILQIIESI